MDGVRGGTILRLNPPTCQPVFQKKTLAPPSHVRQVVCFRDQVVPRASSARRFRRQVPVAPALASLVPVTPARFLAPTLGGLLVR